MQFIEMVVIIAMATIAAWLIVTSVLFVLGVIAAALFEVHGWEEWDDQGEGKEKQGNAEF